MSHPPPDASGTWTLAKRLAVLIFLGLFLVLLLTQMGEPLGPTNGVIATSLPAPAP